MSAYRWPVLICSPCRNQKTKLEKEPPKTKDTNWGEKNEEGYQCHSHKLLTGMVQKRNNSQMPE